MRPSEFIKTDTAIIAVSDISSIDCARIEELVVIVITKQGLSYEATNLNAIELVLQTRPAALEGKRIKGWKAAKFAWANHNLFAHPIMQILAFFSLYKWAFWVHDASVPKAYHKKEK